jgi:GNAT superfamily N-acetyltransferase
MDTFAAHNTPEDMAMFLTTTYGPDLQAAELTDPATVFLIAECNGTAAGYSMLLAGATEVGIGGDHPMELRRIYTLQEWVGRGVGAALIQAAIDEAQQRGHDTLWLGVWEHNPRARAFYRKWGFVEVGTHIFVLGSDPQTDILMQRQIGR